MSTEIMGSSWGERADALEMSRSGEAVFDNVRPGISHDDYRVLVTTAALRSARGRGTKNPNTRDYARSKQVVDKLLLERGLGIKIPGARPGRVTR